MYFQKISWSVSVVLLVLSPLALWSVINLPIGSAGVHQWLPEGRIERARYEKFLEKFGSDQVLIASWEGANVDDKRVQQFIDGVQASAEFAEYCTKVVSPIDIINSLQEPPLSFEPADVLRRLNGTLVGDNGTLAIIIFVNEQGLREHSKVIGFVRSAADDVPGLGRQNLRLVGTVYESFAVDQAASESLLRLVLPSTIMALLISWICVGSVRAVIVVMLMAGAGQLLAVSVVYYCGYQFSAVLVVQPTLIFMLTLSGAVHLVNYLLEIKQDNRHTNAVEAVKLGWWPCVLSSATTMMGMGSLITSQLQPVRQFGMLSAVCLGLATLLLLVVFPTAADLIFQFGKRTTTGPTKSLADSELPTADQPNSSGHESFLRFPEGAVRCFLAWQFRNKNRITVLSILLLLGTFSGIAILKSSTKFCDMFPGNHPTNSDMQWFENNVGLISTVEVQLIFGPNENLLDEAKLVTQVTEHLQNCSQVGGAYSAACFLPEVPDAKGLRATTLRAIHKKHLEAQIEHLNQEGLVYQSDQETIWRISSRVSATSASSFGELTELVKQEVGKVVAGNAQQPRVELTGLSPVMHETQMILLSDLGYSFLSAYILITPVMMWVVRSFWGGLLIRLFPTIRG